MLPDSAASVQDVWNDGRGIPDVESDEDYGAITYTGGWPGDLGKV